MLTGLHLVAARRPTPWRWRSGGGRVACLLVLAASAVVATGNTFTVSDVTGLKARLEESFSGTRTIRLEAGRYELDEELKFKSGVGIIAPLGCDAGGHVIVEAVAPGTVVLEGPVERQSGCAKPAFGNAPEAARWGDRLNSCFPSGPAGIKRVVYIDKPHCSVTLKGLNITGGYAAFKLVGPGGGIYIDRADGRMVTVDNCNVYGNAASQGGGVHVALPPSPPGTPPGSDNGFVTIKNSKIHDNRALFHLISGGASASTGQGGGLWVTAHTDAPPTVVENTAIFGNRAEHVSACSGWSSHCPPFCPPFPPMNALASDIERTIPVTTSRFRSAAPTPWRSAWPVAGRWWDLLA